MFYTRVLDQKGNSPMSCEYIIGIE